MKLPTETDAEKLARLIKLCERLRLHCIAALKENDDLRGQLTAARKEIERMKGKKK